MVNQVLCPPLFWRQAGAKVTIANGHGDHAGGVPGLNVAQVVANVEALLRRETEFPGGKQ